MRKYLYLIVDHPDDYRVGQVEITETRKPRSSKNEQVVMDMRDLDTDETFQATMVSFGHVDYADEDEYEDQIVDDMKSKLAEIDERHLVDAGLDPDDVFDGGDA